MSANCCGICGYHRCRSGAARRPRITPVGHHMVTDTRADFEASTREHLNEEQMVELAEISRLIREQTVRTMERREGETVVEWSRRLAAAVEALR